MLAQALTVQVGAAHKGNVYAQVSVVRRAVETEIDGEGHARPGRVARTAVEADLVGLLALELAE